jgi:hypothetical protein
VEAVGVDGAGVEEERGSDEDALYLEEAGVVVDVDDVVGEPVVIALSTLVVTIAGGPCVLTDAAVVIEGVVVLGADDVREELVTEDRRRRRVSCCSMWS